MFAIFPSSIIKTDVPIKALMHIMVAEKDPYITLPDDGLPHLNGFPS